MLGTARPEENEFAPYYKAYIARCTAADLLSALDEAEADALRLAAEADGSLGDHRYAAGKWTVKEVLQHLIDCERVFTYRALRFARNDSTPLAGFDEDRYAAEAGTAHRTLEQLFAELAHVRASTRAFFGSLPEAQLLRTGIANGNPFSVRALGWAIAGHALHHQAIIRERYLSNGRP
jgi:uncharacterized damage-inducible protein DinB